MTIYCISVPTGTVYRDTEGGRGGGGMPEERANEGGEKARERERERDRGRIKQEKEGRER